MAFTTRKIVHRANLPRTLLVIFILVLTSFMPIQAGEAKWRKAPKPKFPKEALKDFVEGSVTVRAVLTPDGSVGSARVTKTSGDARLDDAAVKAVLRWKMNPAAIAPSDLKEGRAIVFDFTQEAMLGAVYQGGGVAYFKGESAGPWVFAPFPSYPRSARRSRDEGIVLLLATIGPEGVVSGVEVLESSGHPALDNAAITAVRHWRAHKQYEGTKIRFPVKFTLTRP